MSNSKIKLVSLLKERNIIEEGVVKNSKAFNIMAYQIIEHISKSSRLKDGVVEDYVILSVVVKMIVLPPSLFLVLDLLILVIWDFI